MGLNNKKKLTFGLVLNRAIELERTFFYQSKILSGVEDYTKKNGINLISFITGGLDSPNEWEKKKNILFKLINKKYIDGLLILGSAIGLDPESENVRELMKLYKDIPVVFLNSGPGNYPYICVDNYLGMYLVINHLIDRHKCSKIAFIKGPNKNQEAKIRYKAYLDSLKEHGIPFNPDLVYFNQEDFSFSSGINAINYFIDEKKVEFDSIAASNDNIAVGALTELFKRNEYNNRNIPVTGFDDNDISKVYSLTTVRQSFYDQAQYAAKMLIKLIEKEKDCINEQYQPELVLRTSCGCQPARKPESHIVKYDLSKKDFESQFAIAEIKIQRELTKLNSSIEKGLAVELLELEKKLLNAFHDTIATNTMNKFYLVLNQIVLWMLSKNLNKFLLHGALDIFRKHIIKCLSSISQLEKLESLLQDTRIHMEELISREEEKNKLLNNFKKDSIEILGEKLIQCFDVGSMMDILYSELPKYTITSCCIVLYENNDNPLDYARLVLAYDKKGRRLIDTEGIQFQTNEFLPDKLIERLKLSAYKSNVQALFHGDTQIGYIFLIYENWDGNLFGEICDRISLALKNTMLIDKIKKQAQNLEIQVVERTRELTSVNNRLLEEIKTRTNFEIKLKKAMEELEAYNRKLYDQSFRDELTGLFNRRGFVALGNQHYQNSKIKNKSFCVVFADMDGLKRINDRYGHNEGDFAIRKTAELIDKSFRNIDYVARWGGDEFTIIVVDSSPEDVKLITERLNCTFDSYNASSGKPYKLSITTGTAYFDSNSDKTFEDLLADADKTLYKKKKKGNKVL